MILGITLLGCGPQARVAPAPFTTTLQPGDGIQTLSVTLAVGERGAALDEPVALDLGLGYPLWLHPIGRAQGEDLPFGAVAQTSTAGPTLAPGEQATFTFGVAASSGQDALHTTRHLLADTRVGDVRRVGFASARDSDWILGDYEIRINGTVLHREVDTEQPPDAAQQALSARLTTIERELADLRKQYAALAAADATGAKDLQAQALPLLDERAQKGAQVPVAARSAAATRQVDEERLRALQAISDVTAADTVASGPERARIAARLVGEQPWYVAGAFRPPWLPARVADTAVVTVETRAHPGAATRNPVYLRVGGHKYVLNGPYEALSASSGAQVFDLGLAAGTLASIDLRDWALGMLGAGEAQAAVPDRWHAQRLLVTVDGKVVYDSDDDARDRGSLDAVRLIPPAHLDADGTVVDNAERAREVFLWEAGQGLGLAASGTSATPLPASTDPSYPRPESGLATATGTSAGTASPGTWSNAAFPPFPGEQGPVYGGSSSGWGGYGSGTGYGPAAGGGSGPWVQGGLQWGSGGGSAWGGLSGSGWGLGLGTGWGSGSGSGPGKGGSASGGTSTGKSGGGAKTTGKPFQMQEVWISSGWKLNEPFTVEWKVSGDTSSIRHFLVSLRVVRPDQSKGVFKHAAKKPVKVAVGQRSCVVLVDPAFQPIQPYYYLAPTVTAVPKKASKQSPQSHVRIGPARAVFPQTANPLIQPIPKDITWKAGGTGTASTPKSVGVGLTGKPQPPRTAWFQAGAATPDAIQIGVAKPATHVSVRPKAGDAVTLRYEISPFQGRQQLVGHVGFMGKTLATDKFDVELECALLGGGKTYTYPVWKGGVATGTSLRFLQQMLDAKDLGVPMTKAEVRITCRGGGAADPKCVPGVYGLRLFSMAGTVSAVTVDADLEIDATSTWLVPADRRDGIATGPAHELCLAVKNNGPDDIPATLLREIKVVVKYYMGQFGDAHAASTGYCVTCGPYRVTNLWELTSGGKWTGPLPKGGVLRLRPSPPATHTDLRSDGRLKRTKANVVDQTNAHKLFLSWADIRTQGAPGLKESNPNNAWTQIFQPPLIIGKGPLSTEVLLFEKPGYQGTKERYELNPVTQRQRLIWDLRKEPGKADMFWKVGSCMVGTGILLVTADDHHFYSDRYNGPWWYSLPGGTPAALQPKLGRPTGSMILCPLDRGGPIGVSIVCEGHQVLGATIEDPRSMFLPLPEKKSETSLLIKTLHSEFHNEVDQIRAWRTYDGNAAGPKAWMKVTLYEGGNGSGYPCTLAPPFWPRKWNDSRGKRAMNLYGLDHQLWDGLIAGPGAVGVDNDVESLLIELKGPSGY